MALRRFVPASAVVVTLMFGGGRAGLVQAQKGAASPAQPQSGAQAGGGATPYFETQMLAYGAVNQVAAGIAQRVCHATPPLVPENGTVLIFDQSSFQNLGAWQSLVAGAAVLEEAYKTLLSPTQRNNLDAIVPPKAQPILPQEAAGGGTSPSFIQGGADLGSLISAIAASTTNNASTFTIQDSTMAVSLLHQFKRINCNVKLIYYPLFGAYADLDKARYKVTTAFHELNQVRAFIQNNIITDATAPKTATFADLNSQYDALLKAFLGQNSPPGGGNQGQGVPGGAQNPGSPSNSLSSTPTPSQNGGSSGYGSLVQGAELEELIKKDDTYILYADVVAAGGTQRDIKNVFTLLTGDWLSYSGGLIVNVALVKSKETTLELADTLRYRTGYHHRDLWDVLGFKNFTDPKESDVVESANSGSNTNTLCNEERRHHFWQRERPCQQTVVLSPLSFDQNEVTGGASLIGTVMLNTKAPNNVPVALTTTVVNADTGDTDSADAPEVPAVTTVVAGSTAASFLVRTHVVTRQTTFRISANGGTTSTDITIDPLSLLSLSLNPNELDGEDQDHSVGTVVLNGKAPVDGASVELRSSNISVAEVDPTADVRKGEITATFDVDVHPVAADTLVTISAVDRDGNVIQRALLGIHPNIHPTVSNITTTSISQTTRTASPNPFSLTVNGSNFDPNTVEIVLTGPGCTAAPCVTSNDQLTTKTATKVIGPATTSAAGSFTIQVRNGAQAPLSNGQTLTVTP